VLGSQRFNGMVKPQTTDPAFFSAQVSSARRFYLDLAPSPRTPLTVVSGGCECCSSDYRIRRAGFPYLAIEFVAGGEGTLRLDGRNYELGPGVFFTYGPGIAQSIAGNPRRPLLKYFADFAGRRALPLLREFGMGPGRVAQTGAPAEVAGAFEDLIRAGLRRTPHTSRLVALLVERLVVVLGGSSLPYGSSVPAAFSTYLRCRDYIEANWATLRSQEQIAKECHVDPAYLCRLYRRFDHQGPYRALLQLRMSHAASLLQTGAPVKQVADELGYGDPFHFSRVFKSVMGVPPSRLTVPSQGAES
jgi:AraC-like DNA-binding protein